MGNTAPRMCQCREAGATAAAAGERRVKNVVAEAAAPAAPRRVAVAARKQRDGDEEGTLAGRRRGGVSRAGGGDDGAVVRVKIVMKRKDAEALVARLNAQGAREREARMAELKGELRAGDGGGGASPASCRDAWRPGLASIQEN
ncbi:uncharacterized protein LOC133908488 [Phragmites australis]|uniref:uncharacterized protein LOC133908488 n=1 Tax=Phragmites australis TaxID=29695 RepID=UPI002D76E18A|nr:uncharacterized protein LOC133908488 [Phragmites australis]